MEPNLATTNVLLGIMAAVSMLEVLAVLGLLLSAFLLYYNPLGAPGFFLHRRRRIFDVIKDRVEASGRRCDLPLLNPADDAQGKSNAG